MGPWNLIDFIERLDAWIDLEHPEAALRRAVTAWIMTRIDDPYRGAHRESGFDNLWVGEVPGSTRAGKVVVCSYFIYESTRSVRCGLFGTLDLPI